MPCTNCGPSYPVASFVFSGSSACTNCDPLNCPGGFFDATCVNYSGPALSCIGAFPNERIDTILNKIDTKLCTVIGEDPFPGYNTYCLSPTNTQQEFVETISEQFCILLGNFNTFTSVTFPNTVTSLQNDIAALNTPNIVSCPEIGFQPTDTLKVAITRVANYACGIVAASIDVSSVDWNQCSVVADPPNTIVEGFDFVIGRICTLQAQIQGSVVLPTFDNTGTCLPTPTTTDTLEATMLKMRTRLCQTPTFNPSGYVPGCFAVTSSSTLDDTIQEILTTTSDAIRSIPSSFDPAFFSVQDVDPMNPCLGKAVTLIAGPSSSDRHVAVNLGDGSPGTLVDKLNPGTGIILDPVGTPGMLTISVDPANIGDEKVKVTVGDPSGGYLADKITGSTNVITISTPVVSNQVQVQATINMADLIEGIIETITEDDDLKALFCNLVSSCPSPCNPPSNLTVTYVP